MKKSLFLMVGWLFLALLFCQNIFSQATEFSYQGSLKNGASPANGSFDFEFVLFDSLSGGAQVGSTIALNNVAVTNGIFSVKLDFGNQFAGANRFLEIRLRPSGQPGITILSPRQLINSAPYSVKSLTADNATTATNALQLGGITANQYVLTSDLRLSDARNPLPNSPNYIQNTNSQQALSNFNISGNGTIGGNLSVGGAFSLNIVNANAQYNLGGSRVLSNAGTANLFAGVNAGFSNSTGRFNAFFGQQTGYMNTTGEGNAFFGMNAGYSNVTGQYNTFVGESAGASNTASGNAFFGAQAGVSNSTGFLNSFFGTQAGFSNTTGTANTFFGREVGFFNTTGGNNSVFGYRAGISNTTGFDNTLIGASADVGAPNLTNAIAVGYRAFVSQSNSLVLGSINGVNGAFADTKVGIGTTAPIFKLEVVDSSNVGFRVQTNTAGGTVASFGGLGEFQIDSPGVTAGRFRITETGVVGIGSLGFGGTIAICLNGLNHISTCSSSVRYKSNINPFRPGLSLVNRLRPVSFKWKDGGMLDVGLVAEEVAQVEPLLVTYNSKAEIEGVKYDRLNVVLINAVKEQQAEISGQKSVISELKQQVKDQNSKIEAQQKQIDALKELVCLQNPTSERCRQP